LGYLKSSKGKKFYVRISAKDMQIRVFIDAAFVLQFDAKSHKGAVIMVGGAAVYVSSRKQKCVTGSPTEAELVGWTNNLGIVGLFRE
jgi:N-acetylglucosamine kinase-like BadF-type ATPase